jgi:hypothetical protein
MAQWWTYSLADFLMFSPATYFRLFELENLRLWPYQLPAPLAGVFAVMLARGGERAQRAALVLLALACGVCAWTYFHLYYATIHTFANLFAIAFAVQAAVLSLQAAVGVANAAGNERQGARRFGIALAVLAIIALPLLPAAFGRPLAQAEIFAFMPDPTVLAMIGILIATRGASAALFVIPLAWSLYSALTLYTLASAQALMPMLAAALAAVFAVLRQIDRRSMRRAASGR